MHRAIQSSRSTPQRTVQSSRQKSEAGRHSFTVPGVYSLLNDFLCVCVLCNSTGKQPEVEEMFFDIFFTPPFEYVHYAIFPLKF